MSIEIEKTETGYNVKFPYDLKDNFRKNFPSAKWNATKKVWTVGPRSGKRLEQWCEAAKEVAEEIETRDERVMSEKELARLREELESLRSDEATHQRVIEKLESAKEKIDETKALIEKKRAEVKEAAKQRRALEAEVETHKEAITAKLRELIDIDYLKNEAARELGYLHNKVGNNDRELFYEVQEEFEKAQDALRAAGLRCKAIDFCVDANFNRPDRDHVKFLRDDAWYTIEEIDEEDDD